MTLSRNRFYKGNIKNKEKKIPGLLGMLDRSDPMKAEKFLILCLSVFQSSHAQIKKG